ncbi:DUF1643 domain-containing protein [Neobacillus sp. NPDC093182]|uniref:DUF1643 domain-containing protein n=1 Tax=Neobacillus sp. NPDC093182 TaxID=3364297 RepID=UPI00382360D3
MDSYKAFGTFYKCNNFICRIKTFLQFGNGSNSIGSIIMLNPGEASFVDKSIVFDVEEKTGELIPDKTMKRLAEILQQSNKELLNGRFHIYNLFPFQHTSSKNAVKEKQWLIQSYETNKSIIQQFNEEKHPWVLLAWSTEKGSELNRLKEQWISAIHDTDIKVFGLKAQGKLMFYHPFPRIQDHKERYFNEIIRQLQNNEGIVV